MAALTVCGWLFITVGLVALAFVGYGAWQDYRRERKEREQ